MEVFQEYQDAGVQFAEAVDAGCSCQGDQISV